MKDKIDTIKKGWYTFTMREVKFRAWDKKEKVLCNVSVINLDKGALLVGNSLTDPMIYKWGSTLPVNNQGHFCNFENIELMQYTGLKDKNGKEIYEGDLIKHPDTDYIHEVKYGGMACRSDYGYAFPYHINLNVMEIIGNIYENKELLKEIK